MNWGTMNWDAIGAIGEVVGAIAVVVTLLILVVQVRQNNRGLEEANRLNRAATIDRHADSVSRWRGRIMENPDLSRIWLAAIDSQNLSHEDLLRLNNLWIDFINTQRANYVRALTVGETGLARQAVRSVVAETSQSGLFLKLWQTTTPWHQMASPEFVAAVDEELDKFSGELKQNYSASAVSELAQSMKSIIDEQSEQQAQESS